MSGDPPRIAPGRRGALQQYLVACRDVLRLQDWDIEVVPDPGGDVVLSISPQPELHYASVRVGEFFGVPPLEQRQAVAHELVHLAQGDLWWWAREIDAWKQPMAPDHARMIEERVRAGLETHASWAGRALEPLLPPLPTWPE